MQLDYDNTSCSFGNIQMQKEISQVICFPKNTRPAQSKKNLK